MICIVSNPKRLNEAQRKAVEELWPFAMSVVKELRRCNRGMVRIDLTGIAHLALMNAAARRLSKPPLAYVKQAIKLAAVEELRRERRTVEADALSLTDTRAVEAIMVTDRQYEGSPTDYMNGDFSRHEKAILKQWATFPVHQSIRSIADEIGVNYQTLNRLLKRLQECQD